MTNHTRPPAIDRRPDGEPPAGDMHGNSVGALLRGIGAFAREDFDPRLYIPAALLLAAAIAFNYGTDFTNRALYSLPFGAARFTGCFLMLAAAYYLPALMAGGARRERRFIASTEFWLKSLSAIVILTVNFSLFALYPIVLATPIPDALFEFALRVMASIVGTIVVALYMLGLKLTLDRSSPGLYGLSPRGLHLRPYAAMLLAVTPLILAASFLPDFLHVYPTFRPGDAARYLGISNGLLVVLYEIFYLLDFLFVEIFFRGILVIGMVRLMGRSAVLPMAVLYTVAHFGKPFGETVAAVAGGYILGVVAYRSRSVMGGFILHAGIAILMEIFAALQHWRVP